MKKLDARDIPCPKPLILTRQALSKLQLNEQLEVLINDKLAFANITDFLKDTDLEYTTNELNFIITKTKEISKTSAIEKEDKNIIAIIDKQYMGHDNKELGELLLKAFFGALVAANKKPQTVYFYNDGVLLNGNRAYKKLLDELREAGIILKFCGACLKFYEIEDTIVATEHTNMLSIIEAQANASFIIRI